MASLKISTVKKGFTLIELLVVMGLLTFVGGFSLIVSMDSFRGQTFHSERDTLLSTLEKARSQAINNMCFGPGCTNGKAHGVHIQNNQYTIFQGVSFATRDIALDEVIAPKSKALSITGITDVIFAALSGGATTLPAGVASIILTDTTGKDSSSVTVNAEGRLCFEDASC